MPKYEANAMITLDQLTKSLTCPVMRAKRWLDHLNAAMTQYEINTPLRIAHFLSQVGHESGRLIYTAEIASGEAYDKRADLGNTKRDAIAIANSHGSTPGRWWKGHGLIQITGYDNHRITGEALNLDLLNNPSFLVIPEHAAMSAGYFWKSHGLNEIADQDDIMRITKIINGGHNGLDDRRSILMSAKNALKVKEIA